MVSFDNVTQNDLKKIKKYGFIEKKGKSAAELMRYEGECTLVLYKNGRLLLQGKKDAVENTKKILGYHSISNETRNIGLSVGSDETLKGDTFGGIVVCGFKSDDIIRDDLKSMGVKDSKELTKPQISELAQALIAKYPGNFHVENVFPKEYNNYVTKMNVTKLLDMLHEKCHKKLSKTAIHIVDLYPGCSVGDIKETKAESKYPEVAAASIIARYYGLMQIRELEKKAGFFIPFGSSNVEPGLLEIKKKSLNPYDFVKMNFRNVQEFF